MAFPSECHPTPYIPTGSSSKQASNSLSISMQVPGPPPASLSCDPLPNPNINQPTTAHASIVSQPAVMLGPVGASTAPPVAPSNNIPQSQPPIALSQLHQNLTTSLLTNIDPTALAGMLAILSKLSVSGGSAGRSMYGRSDPSLLICHFHSFIPVTHF